MDTEQRRTLYGRLVHGYQALPPATGSEQRWHWLMAAHVVGQREFGLHWDSHLRMLALARRDRDWREAAGQLLRLALVPVGHVAGRLPAGNIGRATVSAFRAMRPPREVRYRIAAMNAGALGPRLRGDDGAGVR